VSNEESFLSVNKDKLVFIFGPTGVGKTGLACEAAQGIGEIISVDSMQVYKGMDCGTAKPTKEQLKKVKHHLVSIVTPDIRFSAGDFRRLALKSISEIQERGKIPILVGGTGLYFRALEYDFIDAPSAQLDIRERLYGKEEKKKGILFKELSRIDPGTAEKLHQNDVVRIVRALEVYYTTGLKYSDLVENERKRRFAPLKIGLNIAREALYSRLESRCTQMLEKGLAGEVYRLLLSGYTEKYPSMKGLGYSHFFQYFKGCYSYRETVRLFIRDTKRYAKRQLTWFRNEKETQWFKPIDVEVIRKKIESYVRL
jgi:tRNA dimethylallyltransferase